MNATSLFARIPPSRNERWQVIQDAVADWFPVLSAHDGYVDPVRALKLPTALREWYQLCGKRADIWSRQDHWNTPEELYEQNDHLIIIVENQSCAFWGIPLAELHNDDPPVFVNMDGNGHWLLENSTTTEFALQMLAFNIKWANEKCWANGCGNRAALERLRESYPRFPFPDWNWPVRPTQFYGTHELIIEVNGADDYIWFWASARSESAFHDFDNLMKPTGIEWEAEKTSL